MSVFPDWQSFAVHQRRSESGCIPTGYEMILRAAGAQSIDFASFQDDFDHDIHLGNGQTEARNNFGSVAASIRERYPWVVFEQQPFETGAEKIAFIDSKVAEKTPVLISLAMQPFGQPGWHIMPIVDATDTEYLVLEFVESDGTPRTHWIKKATIAAVHDQFPGGKEVAFLAALGEPGAA
jgi:hypothetical protein